MRLKLLSTKLFINSLALGLGLLVCSAPLLALAQFEKPKRGVPGRRIPGGTRDPQSCVAGNQLPLIALVPESNTAVTASEYPTFFWYVPQNSAKSIGFELFDENNQIVYQTRLKVPQAPGIISLTLPKTEGIKPLKPNQNYTYWFVLTCNPAEPLADIYVGSYVRRIALNSVLMEKLQKAKPEDLPGVYAASGIWNETLATLADLRQAKPDNKALVGDWAGLMQSVKLDDYANAPLLSCCTPNSKRVVIPPKRR